MKGQLEYRMPPSKERPKGEDLAESLEHFVYPSGLRLEIAPTPPLLHSFVMTCANGSRQYAYVYTKWIVVPDHVLTVVKMQIGENLIDCDDPSPQHLPHTLYGPHSLVFISPFPFYDSLTTILKYMAERFFMKNVPSQICARTSAACPALPASMQLVDSIYNFFKEVTPTRVSLSQMEHHLSMEYPHSLEFRDAVTQYCAQQYQMPRCFDDDQTDELDANEFDEEGDHFFLDTRPPSTDPTECADEIDAALHQCIDHCAFFLPAIPFDNLPILESATLGALFESLDVAHVIAVWNALLCELPCLFVSEQISKLTPSLEAISALLYPMKWPYVYIPVLPLFLTDVLDAPQPFLVGAPRQVLDNLPDALTSGETNIVIVDLDHGTLCMSGNFHATQQRMAKAAALAAASLSPSTCSTAYARTLRLPPDEPANPFPDPFATNTKLLTLILQAQGIGQEDSAIAQLERLFASNPVTFLGASLLDTVGPSHLSFSDLNPFRSSGSSGTTSSLDGGGTVAGDIEADLLPQPAHFGTGEARHRFLPWNLVWRLFDGVCGILHPLLAQQRDMEQREREERGSVSGPFSPHLPMSRTASSPQRFQSFSISPTNCSSFSLSTPQPDRDVSSPLGGLHLLSSLPPNLPSHAWPVLLPGLVREWRTHCMEQASKRKSVEPDAFDPTVLAGHTYLGSESTFLARFQHLIEKAKKPILLLSTARFLYSGTDVSSSEGELADDEPISCQSHVLVSKKGPTPPRHPKSHDDDGDDLATRSFARIHSMPNSGASSLAVTPAATPSHAAVSHRTHVDQSRGDCDDLPPPSLLHMTSTPEIHRDLTPKSHHLARSASTAIAPSTSSSTTPRGQATTDINRLTPLSSEDECFADEEDDDSSTSIHSRPTHTREKSQTVAARSDSKLSHFRTKQISLSHLAPPRLGGGSGGNGGGGGGIVDSLESSPVEPPTPSYPATLSPCLKPRVLEASLTPCPMTGDIISRPTSTSPHPEGDPDGFALVSAEDEFSPSIRTRERASITNEVLDGNARPPARPSSDSSTTQDPSSPITIAIHAPTAAVTDTDTGTGTTATRPSAEPSSSPPIFAHPATTPSPRTTTPPARPVINLPLRELSSSAPSSLWSGLSSHELLSLRRRFLSVLVSLLHSHRAFTGFARKDLAGGSYDPDVPEEESYEVTFESASFLRYVHRDYRPFLSLFLETQMMKFFSEERLTRESSTTSTSTTASGGMVKSGSHNTLSIVASDSRGPSVPSSPNGHGSTSQLGTANSYASINPSSLSASAPPSHAHSIPNDWFDRLCAQKRNRTRVLMNASGENGLAGLLYKLGRKVPTWKERWFELNRHGTILRYYSHSARMIELEPLFKELKRRYKLSPRDVVTKANLDRIADQREKLRTNLYRGEITIIPGQTIVHIPSQTRKYMTPYCFEVITPTRSLLACAPDLKTRDEWILLIRARAAKLSIDHKRIGANGSTPLIGLGTIPHLESRLQMQLRILREKNIAARTKQFMERAKKQKKEQEKESHQGDGTTTCSPKPDDSNRSSNHVSSQCAPLPSSQSCVSLATSASTLGQVQAGSLPHALLVCEHLRTSLDLRKFSTLFKTHPHCFGGKDATNYILQHGLCQSLQDAVDLCNLMLKEGLILNVNHSTDTSYKSDPKYMYTFPKHSLLHGSGTGTGLNGEGEVSASSLLPTEEERVIVARMREELDVRDRTQGIFRSVVKDAFVARVSKAHTDNITHTINCIDAVHLRAFSHTFAFPFAVFSFFQDAITWLLDRGICSNESAAVRLATRLVRTSQVIPVNSSFGHSGSTSSLATHEVENNGDLYKFHAAVSVMDSTIEEKQISRARPMKK